MWHPHLHNRRIHKNSTCRVTSVSLPKAHHDTLSELAKINGISRSAVVRNLIELVALGIIPANELSSTPRGGHRNALKRGVHPNPGPHANQPPSNQSKSVDSA